MLKASQVLRCKLCKSVSASLLRTEGITDEQRSTAADLLQRLNTTDAHLPAIVAPAWAKEHEDMCQVKRLLHLVQQGASSAPAETTGESGMGCAMCHGCAMCDTCIRRLPPGYPCPVILVDQLDLLDLLHALVSSQKPQHQHPPPWPQRLHPLSQLHSGLQTQRP